MILKSYLESVEEHRWFQFSSTNQLPACVKRRRIPQAFLKDLPT
jgi:hypothetical protein